MCERRKLVGAAEAENYVMSGSTSCKDVSFAFRLPTTVRFHRKRQPFREEKLARNIKETFPSNHTPFLCCYISVSPFSVVCHLLTQRKEYLSFSANCLFDTKEKGVFQHESCSRIGAVQKMDCLCPLYRGLPRTPSKWLFAEKQKSGYKTNTFPEK